jgi:hypothetical protein
MDSQSPAVADAFQLLLNDLYAHLDEVEFLAMKYGDWTEEDTKSARAVIPDLVTVIRVVLALHDSRAYEICDNCREAWPCEAFQQIHRLVKDPDGEYGKLLARARES